jgi:sterol O-acyltransferase
MLSFSSFSPLFSSGIFYLYIIFAGVCIPEYQATASRPGDLKALFVSLFNSVLPGIATYLLAFFGLLHCWMNMWAELTRFADRLFYQDWSAAAAALAGYWGEVGVL